MTAMVGRYIHCPARARSFAVQVDAIKSSSVRRNLQPVQSWVHNLNNERVRIVELNGNMFAQPLRRDILQRVARWYMAAKRGWSLAATKGRGDVSGGGKKPHAQKGSGKARQGSSRSPINRGGGHVFNKSPRDFSFNLPEKVRRLGLKVALSARFREGNILIIDRAEVQKPRTKDVIAIKKLLGLSRQTLFVDSVKHNKNFMLSARNIPDLNFVTSPNANVYNILKYPQIVLTTGAIAEIEIRLLSEIDSSDTHNNTIENLEDNTDAGDDKADEVVGLPDNDDVEVTAENNNDDDENIDAKEHCESGSTDSVVEDDDGMRDQTVGEAKQQ